MKTATKLCLFALVFIFGTCSAQVTAPPLLFMGGMFPINIFFVTDAGGVVQVPILPGVQYTYNVAIAALNADPTILPNTQVNTTFWDTNALPTLAMAGMLINSQFQTSILIGPLFTDETTFSAIAGAALRIPQLSPACTAQALESRQVFSYFNRMVAPDYEQMQALTDILLHFRKQTGQKQWTQVGIYAQSDDLGVGLTGNFFRVAALKDVEILGFQQALTVRQNNNVFPDHSRDLRELKKTGARVFLSFWTTTDFNEIVPTIMDEGMFGKQYVWMCYEGCSDGGIAVNLTNPFFPPFKDRVRATAGMLGLSIPEGFTPEFLALRKAYAEFNPIFPNLDRYSALVYDSVIAGGRALDLVINAGLPLTPDNVNALLKNVTFDGMTGHIAFKANGNRKTLYNILNAKVFEDVPCFECIGISPNNGWVRVGTYDEEDGLRLDNGDFPITFYDRSEDPPDLDVREPFDYWSCKDGEKKTDETGKKIELQTPDGDDVKYIKEYYRCDGYIDCQNMSDEGYDCATSYTILFIVMGIITALMILCILFCCVPFALVFGCCISRARVRTARPLFLLVICASCIVGCACTYAWYGKPQLVACNFQSWLLALSATSLIAALLAKLFRIWRTMASPLKFKIISDIEVAIVWAILMVPTIFLLFLWTLISTPTARMRNGGDKHNHYLCDTGGFTGPPGGYVFFFIIVGYLGLLILAHYFLAFLTRNVPSRFSEKKGLVIAMFNIMFTGIVVIIVFLIIDTIEPFAAWIIRTVGILYGFFSTAGIIFIPKMVALVFIDRLKDKKPDTPGTDSMGGFSGSASASATASPSLGQ